MNLLDNTNRKEWRHENVKQNALKGYTLFEEMYLMLKVLNDSQFRHVMDCTWDYFSEGKIEELDDPMESAYLRVMIIKINQQFESKFEQYKQQTITSWKRHHKEYFDLDGNGKPTEIKERYIPKLEFETFKNHNWGAWKPEGLQWIPTDSNDTHGNPWEPNGINGNPTEPTDSYYTKQNNTNPSNLNNSIQNNTNQYTTQQINTLHRKDSADGQNVQQDGTNISNLTPSQRAYYEEFGQLPPNIKSK